MWKLLLSLFLAKLESVSTTVDECNYSTIGSFDIFAFYIQSLFIARFTYYKAWKPLNVEGYMCILVYIGVEDNS